MTPSTIAPATSGDLTPALYVVATPLGNLGDISPRALAVLGAADVVACEDTRHSRKLLDHFGIRTRLVAVHQHNEEQGARHLIELLAEGKCVALISDAGTPAVSDPGARVVARVREAGWRVIPIPGANAAITALSAAGLQDGHFLFYGFLPARQAERRSELAALKALPYALVFYETPHRVVEAVADLAATLEGDRTLVVARELTKLFESIDSMPLAAAPTWFAADANRQRGELVLIVSAAAAGQEDDGEAERVLRLLLGELPLKQAVKLAAQITGSGKNTLYQQALELKGE
jgi:16S rRNA (cytidine1402-2'-O)-methyltransferase